MKTKKEIRQILANDRYATRPADVSLRQWTANKNAMEKTFMREWMATPPDLYTAAEIWRQTFAKLM